MENVARNGEAEIENNSSSEENLLNYLATEIESKFYIVNCNSQPIQDRIVRAVDPLLSQVNEDAYRPKFVIIGPLRWYHDIVEDIEKQKRLYLDSFLRRAGKERLNDFLKLIKDSADRIHRCYEIAHQRTWDFNLRSFKQNIQVSDGWSVVLIEMVLVDASFIIELFLRTCHEGGKEESNFIFEPVKMRRDLFLTHNQLPFFIIKDLYQLAFGRNRKYPSFLQLTCHFFGPYYNQNTSIQDIMRKDCHVEYRAKLEGAKHFTDLLRTLQIPYSFQKDCSKEKSLLTNFLIEWIKTKVSLCTKFLIEWLKTKVVYFVDLISSTSLPSSRKPEESLEEGKVRGEYLYSAVLLRDAGVKFKASASRCLLDIEFNQKTGKLKIPPLRVDESTEPFFRNLMAWEKCYYPHDTHICDYIFLMVYLIKSTEDVDLLIRRRIIINQLSSNTTVVTLFNNICRNVTQGEKNRYSDIFRKLNAYNAVRRHGWIAKLRLRYFSTPWTGLATIAAVVLLLLTLIQTICALISL